jgi:hypothetical protein
MVGGDKKETFDILKPSNNPFSDCSTVVLTQTTCTFTIERFPFDAKQLADGMLAATSVLERGSTRRAFTRYN